MARQAVVLLLAAFVVFTVSLETSQKIADELRDLVSDIPELPEAHDLHDRDVDVANKRTEEWLQTGEEEEGEVHREEQRMREAEEEDGLHLSDEQDVEDEAMERAAQLATEQILRDDFDVMNPESAAEDMKAPNELTLANKFFGGRTPQRRAVADIETARKSSRKSSSDSSQEEDDELKQEEKSLDDELENQKKQDKKDKNARKKAREERAEEEVEREKEEEEENTKAEDSTHEDEYVKKQGMNLEPLYKSEKKVQSPHFSGASQSSANATSHNATRAEDDSEDESEDESEEEEKAKEIAQKSNATDDSMKHTGSWGQNIFHKLGDPGPDDAQFVCEHMLDPKKYKNYEVETAKIGVGEHWNFTIKVSNKEPLRIKARLAGPADEDVDLSLYERFKIGDIIWWEAVDHSLNAGGDKEKIDFKTRKGGMPLYMFSVQNHGFHRTCFTLYYKVVRSYHWSDLSNSSEAEAMHEAHEAQAAANKTETDTMKTHTKPHKNNTAAEQATDDEKKLKIKKDPVTTIEDKVEEELMAKVNEEEEIRHKQAMKQAKEEVAAVEDEFEQQKKVHIPVWFSWNNYTEYNQSYSFMMHDWTKNDGDLINEHDQMVFRFNNIEAGTMLRGALRSPEGVDFDLRLEEKLDLGTEYDWVHLAGSWQQGRKDQVQFTSTAPRCDYRFVVTAWHGHGHFTLWTRTDNAQEEVVDFEKFQETAEKDAINSATTAIEYS